MLRDIIENADCLGEILDGVINLFIEPVQLEFSMVGHQIIVRRGSEYGCRQRSVDLVIELLVQHRLSGLLIRLTAR